jgi:hypothetical protein
MSEPVPSRTRTLKGLALAAIVAAIVVVTLVLPAEYGIDPTGVGKVLGLTAMKAAPATKSETAALIDDVLAGNDALATTGSGDEPTPLPNPAVHQPQAAEPQSETLVIKLGPDEKTEIKAQLGKGKMILYSWSVAGGKVYVDFHGHDPALGDKFWVRYEEADGITGRNGSLVAPFKGEHGWYWLNVSDGPVTITLKVTGYQDKLVNYGLLK